MGRFGGRVVLSGGAAFGCCGSDAADAGSCGAADAGMRRHFPMISLISFADISAVVCVGSVALTGRIA